MIDLVSIGLIVTIVGQGGVVWYKMGQLERAIKRPCPFGDCPLYKRAQVEAAPERTAGEE